MMQAYRTPVAAVMQEEKLEESVVKIAHSPGTSQRRLTFQSIVAATHKIKYKSA